MENRDVSDRDQRNMAEAAVESPVGRYYCHRCLEQINPVLPDYTCPRCEGGFIEDLAQTSAEPSEESDEDAYGTGLDGNEEVDAFNQVAELWNMLSYIRPQDGTGPIVPTPAAPSDGRENRWTRPGPSRRSRYTRIPSRRTGQESDTARSRTEGFLQQLVTTLSENTGLVSNASFPVQHLNPLGGYSYPLDDSLLPFDSPFSDDFLLSDYPSSGPARQRLNSLRRLLDDRLSNDIPLSDRPSSDPARQPDNSERDHYRRQLLSSLWPGDLVPPRTDFFPPTAWHIQSVDSPSIESSFLNLHSNPGDYAWGRGGWNAIITQLINQLDGTGPPPLPKEKIDEIPTVNICQEQVDKNLQCTVCMEDFEKDEPVRRLACDHHFHNGCITPWLELHGTCPICRKLLNDSSASQENSYSPSSRNLHDDMMEISEAFSESSGTDTPMPDSDTFRRHSRRNFPSVYDFTDDFD